MLLLLEKRSQKNGAVNFGSQGWVAYENGFGTVSSDHWLGFTKLRRILALGSGQLRIDMTTTGNTETYAHYTGFNIGDAASKYTLTWSGFSGSVWNALTHHQNRRFTTHDQDNDYWWPANCGNSYWGQNNWWYGACWHSNMNGDGTYGMYFAGYNRKTQLAVRIVRAATVPSYDCTVCPVGQYQGVSDFGGTTCTDCAKGQHQNNEGGGSCKNCIAGVSFYLLICITIIIQFTSSFYYITRRYKFNNLPIFDFFFVLFLASCSCSSFCCFSASNQLLVKALVQLAMQERNK